ncbi:MAG: polysaccharide biosynthesis protein [Candidatus Daviesbacteria bacterium]|nr:MAG: polysaccharide biosynthesis protein [Candidatus Daviesbacteria bacterium]
MNQLDLSTISKRAVAGALSLTFRRVALQAISFITINLILARILSVSTLGIFNIATAAVSFFSFFSDIGLAAAIIQKKDKVTAEDLRTTFTIQETLIVVLTVVIWFSAPFLAHLYNLNDQGMWLIRALGVSFLITSFKVIPSVLLERELKFNPLVGVEILETLTFNVVLLILVLMKADLAAFSAATLLRAMVGVVTIYLLAPWKIGFGFSRSSAKVLLNFGIPYQLNSLLSLLKDRLVPLVIAKMIGSVGVGYVTWAQNLAFLPLEVMNIVIRVSFPTFARLQEDQKMLKVAVEKSLFLTTLFLYPMFFGLLALAPSLVAHVVSDKWQPALPVFYLFSVSTFWATLSTTFTNTLNAIGQIKLTLKLMIFWTVITWILTPLLTIKYGFIGVGISSAAISFTSIITIIIVKRFVEVEIWKNIWQPLVASMVMGAIVFYFSQFLVYDTLSLLEMVIAGAAIYLGLIIILAKDKISQNLQEVKSAFSN